MQASEQRTHRLDWVATILIILLALAASERLVATKWTDYLYFAQTLAVSGAILGLALGYSMFKRQAVVWLTIGYSIVLIPGQLSLAIDQDVQLAERLASVGGRLLFSLGQFFRREPVDDGLLFLAFISTLLWFLCVLSGYWWTRHSNYLAAILPNGIFTLTIQLYDRFAEGRIWFLGVYILFSLVLLGRLYYLQNRESWQKRRVFLMQESAFDLTRGVIITAALFIFVSWTVPATQPGWEAAIRTWHRITKPWRDAQEWFSNAVESLDASNNRVSDDLYTFQLGLGTGNTLSEDVIFGVEVPNLNAQPPRFYWRGYTYSIYENNQWISPGSSLDDYSPSENNLNIPDKGDRTVATFIFATQIKQSLLYTASQPLWVSRPGKILTTTLETDEQDLSAWFADPGLSPGEQYQVRASLANPSKDDLQVAGTDYPQWVTDEYLQLPEDFSPRIRELAAEITTGLDTPYDKAEAITAYLRSEIVYANPLPESIPSEENPLEWVLFDLKQGFCNYYASAEVLMLRSLGIPARMAVGFAEGDFDSEARVFIVRGEDAHAWPEVYFPEIGWVEFEPTGNQDPLIRPNRPETSPELTPIGPEALFPRPEDRDSQLQNDPFADVENIEINNQVRPLTSYPLFYIGIFVILAGLFAFLNQRYSMIDNIPVRIQASYEKGGWEAPAWIRNWAKWTMLTPIERSYETINRSLRLLGEKPPVYATPAERSRVLSELLPKVESAIETLTEQHQSSLFTSQYGNASVARRASLSIWLYTIQVIIQNFFKRLERKFSRPGQFQ